jgi:hypothetical protein
MNTETTGVRLVYSDHLCGVALMLLAAFCLYESWHLPFGTLSAPDAGFFPRLLSFLLLLCGAAVTAWAFLTSPQQVEFGGRTWHVVIATVLLILYALTLQYIGYLTATMIVVVVLMRWLSRMTWTSTLAIAVPSVLLSWLAFSKLGVPLPSGIMPF